MIRIHQPIYMEPISRIGRAHFYAPYKKIGEVKIDTFLFNVVMIWFTSFLLYLALYYDLLRKAIGLFENVRIRKNSLRKNSRS